MPVYKQQLIAIERSIEIVEELGKTLSVPDTSVQALNNTYEVLESMARNVDEAGINTFFVPQT